MCQPTRVNWKTKPDVYGRIWAEYLGEAFKKCMSLFLVNLEATNSGDNLTQENSLQNVADKRNEDRQGNGRIEWHLEKDTEGANKVKILGVGLTQSDIVI